MAADKEFLTYNQQIEILGGTKQYAKRWKYYKATALYSASILERIFIKLSRCKEVVLKKKNLKCSFL